MNTQRKNLKNLVFAPKDAKIEDLRFINLKGLKVTLPNSDCPCKSGKKYKRCCMYK